jgi:hypothetical protein
MATVDDVRAPARELVLGAWRMVVPERVAAAYHASPARPAT